MIYAGTYGNPFESVAGFGFALQAMSFPASEGGERGRGQGGTNFERKGHYSLCFNISIDNTITLKWPLMASNIFFHSFLIS